MIALLRFLAGSSRGVMLASVAAGAAGGASGVALIALIQAELARESPGPRGLAAAFAGLCLASGACRVASQAAMARLGQGAVATLTRHVAGRILDLPLRSFEAMDRSALLAVLTEDIGLIAGALVGVPQLCINLPIVVGCLAYVGWLSPAVLVAGVAFAASAIWVFLALSGRGVAGLRRARAEQDALVGHLRALIDGFRELKLHRGRREAFRDEALGPAAESVRRLNSAALGHFAVAAGWSQVMFFGFIGLALYAIPGLGAADRPSTIAVVLVVLYLMGPLDVILNWLPALGRARASLGRVEALLPALARGGAEGDAPAAGLRSFEEVELDGVTFAYGAEAEGFAFGPVDLTLRRGELVILAGGNGSGKTTLVKLLSGLYAPEAGAVRLDGRAVDDAGREAYRGLFSTVYADGHLFPDVLGLDAPDLEARAAEGLRRLGLAGEVAVLERRFSTVDLSQGRRRRLALLGAWLEDRPIVILDEWAANQDPRSRRDFYRELLPEWKAAGKTLLVISHDEAYFDVADRVVHLGEGRVADHPAAPAVVSHP